MTTKVSSPSASLAEDLKSVPLETIHSNLNEILRSHNSTARITALNDGLEEV